MLESAYEWAVPVIVFGYYAKIKYNYLFKKNGIQDKK